MLLVLSRPDFGGGREGAGEITANLAGISTDFFFFLLLFLSGLVLLSAKGPRMLLLPVAELHPSGQLRGRL